MIIRVNEEERSFEDNLTAKEIATLLKPDADLIIVNGFPAEVSKTISDGDSLYLIKKGEHLSEDELERLMMARHTPGVHAKIKSGTVGIAGVGGLGSLIAIELARIGVGKIVFADFDVVEPSNLNRQHYFIDQIGMPKVYALSETLKRINPFIKIEPQNVMISEDNASTIFAGCSVVAEAFDRADMKAMLVNTLLEKTPECIVVAASGLAGFDSSNSIVTKKIGERLYVAGDLKTGAEHGRGLMAPRVAVAASHQANQILRILLGIESV